MKSKGYLSEYKAFVCILTILTFVALLSQDALANGFRNPPAGATALSMDGGKTAFIDDASAISHNPANLMDLKRKKAVMVATTFVYPATDYESRQGDRASTKDSLKILPNLYAVWPVRNETFVAGIGVTTPYGQSTEWEKTAPFPYFSELIVVNVNPSLATKISDNLSIGAGINIYFSELDIRSMLGPGASAKLKGDGNGLGGSMGATWQFAPRQRVALTYVSAFDVEYDGDTEITGTPKSDFESEINFPNIVTLGYGIQLTDTIRIAADVEWVDFSRNESMPMDYGNNPAAAQLPPEMPQDWEDVWTGGIAGSWQFRELWTLRGSYKYLESPIPDRTYSPAFQDADKHMIALGLGWDDERHALDVGYTLVVLEDRDITGNVNRAPDGTPLFDGDYEFSSHVAGISYSYSF